EAASAAGRAGRGLRYCGGRVGVGRDCPRRRGTEGGMANDTMENRSFDELAGGDAASLTRTITREDAAMLAALAHGLPSQEVAGTAAGSGAPTYPVGYAALAAMLVPVVLGTALPGPGTVYRAQSLRFLEPVAAGAT